MRSCSLLLLTILSLYSCKKGLPTTLTPPLQIELCDDDSIWCAGNSLTANVCCGYVSYPTYLAQMLGRDTIVVKNAGVYGWTSTQITDRFVNRTGYRDPIRVYEGGSNNNWWREQIKQDIRRFVGNSQRYLVFEVMSGSLPDRWPGGPWGYYEFNEETNNQLEAEHGNHFVRIKRFLQQFQDGSQQDSIDVKVHDAVPSSLRSDFIHHNNKANELIARLVKSYFKPCQTSAN